MKRIAGIVNFARVVAEPDELDRMSQAMKLQGDERINSMFQGEAGFTGIWIGARGGNRAEFSPCIHPTGRFMVIFDGHIHNRQELLGNLHSQLSSGRHTLDDEELLVAAYEKWGLDFPKHLVGDFALALWDEAERHLVCVRDHFGVKPFYYAHNEDCFLFASTPIAIVSSRKIPAHLYEERIADHLVDPLEGVDKTSTFYKAIFRLPPAHMLVAHSMGVSLQRYWDLSPVETRIARTDEENIESFRKLFEKAVSCRLKDSSGTASMLSGGLDSSSIAGMGCTIHAAQGGNRQNVVAAISSSPDTNRETAHIRSMLAWMQFKAHLISEDDVLHRMDELVHSIETEEEPFDCLMNLNRSVYLLAREQSFGAVLDGVDGDVLLSGSGILLQLWHECDLQSILDETIRAEGLTAEYKTGRKEFLGSLLATVAINSPDWLRNISRPFRYRHLIPNAIRGSIIDPDFAICSNLGERFARLYAHSPKPSSINQVEFHKNTLNHPYLTVGLERYERVASSFGIEALHPLIDVRLAEFCIGLPWQLKTRHGWRKLILRRTMEPYLPSEVVWRRDKDSLMWEYNRLILRNKAAYFHQATLDEKEILKPYVDTQKLEKFWQEYLLQGDEKQAEQLWSGIALAFWLRRHRNMVRDLDLQQ